MRENSCILYPSVVEFSDSAVGGGVDGPVDGPMDGPMDGSDSVLVKK